MAGAGSARPRGLSLRATTIRTQERLAFEAQIDLTYMGGIERGREIQACL